jgi:hypothetical protein
MTVTLVPSAMFRGAATARVVTLRTVSALCAGALMAVIGSYRTVGE